MLLIIAISVLMLVFPSIFSMSSLDGLSLFATKIFPLMFPFMFFSKLLYLLGFFDKISPPFNYLSQKLYNIKNKSVGFVWICSLVCGYPIGAKIISNLLCENKIEKNEAQKLLSFCSTCSPVFILGAIGMSLGNSKLAFVILITHYIASILNGFVFRMQNSKSTVQDNYETQPYSFQRHNNIAMQPIKQALNFNQKVAASMEESLSAALSVGGYIIVFYVLCDGLKLLTKDNLLANILVGLVEMSRGSLFTATTPIPLFIVGVIICFLVSFGGLCVHLQHFHFLAKHKLSYLKFLLQKTIQGILHSIVFTLSFLLLF